MNTKIQAAMFAGAIAALSATAYADNAQTPDGSLTWKGITLYGTLDAGVQYQSQGAPESDYFPPGTNSIIQKNSNGSQTSVGGNNLSQSKLGIKGQEEFGNGWSGVFKAEIFINPWSGQISDALKSVTLNNGKALAVQNTGVDSSIAGQLFGGVAYLGVSNAQFGTLTFGRNMGVLADGIGKYDPMLASQAFSPLGFSGTAAGGGDTEDRRLDSSVKYDAVFSGIHVAAQFQPKTGANPGTTQEFAVGFAAEGGSIDVFYMQKNDAIAAASLSAAQLADIAAVCAGTATATQAADYSCAAQNKGLSATISDNSTTGVMGKYIFASIGTTVSAGYEQIKYTNPSDPVLGNAGQAIIGGYVLATTSNTAFPSTKKLGISWIGAKFTPMANLDLTGAYYRYDQNSFSTAHPGCSSAETSSQCSGSENFLAFVADYHFTKRFDSYVGAMWSQVEGGLANGYLHTSTIDPTIGFRYSF
ncbi:MAG: porin [Steroidobacterales bacterium]